MTFTLTSSDFQDGSFIPDYCTCDQEDASPALEWQNPPSGTQSFALIVDDPDAPMGIWDHWIIYNLPKTTKSLEKNVKILPKNTLDGKNSWNKTGYGGPCPPDCEHRYFFKLYALDILLEDKGALSKKDLFAHMKGHILDVSQLMGRYDLRKRRV